jgi:hypothetical protein
MTAESEAFEQLNTRIAELVQGHGARVLWNGAIPDPDSPADARQIDVLIETDDGRTISVECRHRSGAQSVMWIEELAGRKLSLGLDGMIAVSAAGFTSLARKKAKRFGIILYDFDSLTDEEIASWPGRAEVEASFVQFGKLSILAGIPQIAEPSLSYSPVLRFQDKDGYSVIMDWIRDDALAHPGQDRTRMLDRTNFTVDGIPLTLLECSFSGQLVTLRAACVSVSKVGEPGVPSALRDIAVQKFEHSVPEIVWRGPEAHIIIDVSNLRAPSDSILHEFRVRFPSRTTVSKFELVGTPTIQTRATKVELKVATTA